MRNFVPIAAAAGVTLLSASFTFAGTVNSFADQDEFGDATTLGSGFTATVQDAGIRAATNGTRFFNVQGPGSFASWGGLRFDLGELYAFLDAEAANGGFTGWVINDVSLSITQSNASFSTSGNMSVGLSSDDATDIDPRTAAGTLGGNGGVYGGELGVLSFVTNFSWVVTATGDVDTFNIASAAVLAEMNDDADNFLTLVLEAPDAGTAITLKGQDSPFAGANAPFLTVDFTLVPTPGSLSILGLGALVALRRRR